MDEKELIKRIRNSFRAKKSRAEISAGFQKRGYKLAYADELISKVKYSRRIVTLFLLTILIRFCIAFGSYHLLDKHKMELSNPISIITGNTIATSSNSNQQEVLIDQIEITPEFISYLLNEIKTYKRLSQKADLQFDTNKEDLIKAMASENLKSILKQSPQDRKTQLKIFSSETELFSKGYLEFYNFLK